jgi:hypothetical protein
MSHIGSDKKKAKLNILLKFELPPNLKLKVAFNN